MPKAVRVATARRTHGAGIGAVVAGNHVQHNRTVKDGPDLPRGRPAECSSD